jgi:hypothetical protein
MKKVGKLIGAVMGIPLGIAAYTLLLRPVTREFSGAAWTVIYVLGGLAMCVWVGAQKISTAIRGQPDYRSPNYAVGMVIFWPIVVTLSPVVNLIFGEEIPENNQATPNQQRRRS